MLCFRIRYHQTQGLFKKVVMFVEVRGKVVDRLQYKALKEELQVVSKHNIDNLETRVKAMWQQIREQL